MTQVPPPNRQASFLAFASPRSTGAAFAKKTFRGRCYDWANGLRKTDAPNCVFPSVMIPFYLIKMFPIYLGMFYWLVRDPSVPLYAELNAKRFLVYTIFGDAIGRTKRLCAFYFLPGKGLAPFLCTGLTASHRLLPADRLTMAAALRQASTRPAARSASAPWWAPSLFRCGVSSRRAPPRHEKCPRVHQMFPGQAIG